MGFKKNWITVAAVGIAICWCFPLTVFGSGKFIVTPKIAAGWQVDSNFWKSEDDEQEVFTYLIQPGVELGYKTGKSLVSLNYALNAFFMTTRTRGLPDNEKPLMMITSGTPPYFKPKPGHPHVCSWGWTIPFISPAIRLMPYFLQFWRPLW